MTYTSLVIIVNIKILTNANNFTFFNFFFSIGSIIYYFFNLPVLNVISWDYLYRDISNIFYNGYFYLTILFLTSALILIDNGLHLA